jgi:hypothetical protein
MNQDGWNYEVRLEDGLVHTVFRGNMSPAATGKAIADSAAKAKTYDDKRVLFDFRNAEFSKDYLTASIAEPTVARELGIDPGFRIAFLSETNRPVVREIETVALSRGYTAKAFANRDEAIAWLKSA